MSLVSEPSSAVSILLAFGEPREKATAAELRTLLHRHDLSGLQWTSTVVIERGAVPHSHPVLTLNTANSGDALLSAYFHEQLHWWTAEHPGTRSAISAIHHEWSTVPTADRGGARDADSTRLHLIVCHLERRALQYLLGQERAAHVIEAQISRQIYPWVRRAVVLGETQLDQILADRGLLPSRLDIDPPFSQ